MAILRQPIKRAAEQCACAVIRAILLLPKREQRRPFEELCLAKITIFCRNRQVDCGSNLGQSPCKTGLMLRLLRFLSTLPFRFFCSRRDLVLENLALRQQLIVLTRRRPQPRFSARDRLFWVTLRRFWRGWKQALILVQPETVVRWHRAGFKLYWTWLSRHRVQAGRKCISKSHAPNKSRDGLLGRVPHR